MGPERTIVIGASAGGVETLIQLCQALPADLNAAVLIVLHILPTGNSMLPQILTRAGALPAHHAVHEEEIEAGCIYIAPPNHHLLVSGSRLFLSLGPRENSVRPAVDALFRSAARSLGPSLIGIILSGTLGDGSLGIREIKGAGGVTIVQDPEEALFDSMPLNAIRTGQVDFVLPLQDIVKKVVGLVRQPDPQKEGTPMQADPYVGEQELQADREKFLSDAHDTPRTLLTCPDCGGVLWEVHGSKVHGYRCQIGHQYSEESLGVSHANSVEAALWTAIRLLEERVALASRLASRAQEQGLSHSINRYREMETDASRTAAIIRNLISSGQLINPILPPENMSGRAGSETGH